MAERRQLDDQRLPRGLDKADQRVDRCLCIRIGRHRFLAAGPDAVNGRAARGVAAHTVRSGVLRDKQIDRAKVTQGELQRAGLDLRRSSGRLLRIERECPAGHLGERDAG